MAAPQAPPRPAVPRAGRRRPALPDDGDGTYDNPAAIMTDQAARQAKRDGTGGAVHRPRGRRPQAKFGHSRPEPTDRLGDRLVRDADHSGDRTIAPTLEAQVGHRRSETLVRGSRDGLPKNRLQR